MASFTNQATLTYNGLVTNSNVASGELLEVLSAAKTAVIDNYAAGGTVTYILSLVNAGTTAFNGLTVTDSLGEYTAENLTLYPLRYVDGSLRYYINGTLQTTAPTVTAGPPLTITGINVPANGNVMLIYETAVTQFAPLSSESTITNSAVITGAGFTPLTASAIVTADPTPRLTISKSICPSTVTENGQITYTFILQNSGNTEATAADNAVVTDYFDPLLSNLSVTFNDAAWSEPTNYTYDTTTGLFSTVAGQITVPAATYTQDPTTGVWITNPGVSILTVSGTV